MGGPTGEPRRSLVAIQSGTSGPPLYCFHAFGGSVAPYGELAPHIGREFVLHGLEAAGLAGGNAPEASVLDMAHRYAVDIADNPPDGPCVFLGYSLGGVLAVEAARLLAHFLNHPPLVIAIDSDPRFEFDGPDDAWSILAHQVLNLDLPVDNLSSAPRAEALAAVRAAASAQRRLPARFSLDRLGLMFDVCVANARAAARHRPQPFTGRVVSLRSGGAPAAGAPEADRWRPYVADLVVQHLPGDHHSIMTPAGYPDLGRRIRDLITAPEHARGAACAPVPAHADR